MNGFKRICAVIIGTVLLVAGILKMMDPVGSGLVMDEYLNFFHLGFLRGASRFIACALALVESLLGAALIAGVWRKVIALASGGLLALFTILTIILYLAKPNMDCGCFGEIIHLSHAQTLLKNLILDALWCLAFIPLEKLGLPQRIKYVSSSLAAVSLVLFLICSVLGARVSFAHSGQAPSRWFWKSSPKTVEAYGRDVRAFLDFLAARGKTAPGALVRADVADHVGSLRAAGGYQP